MSNDNRQLSFEEFKTLAKMMEVIYIKQVQAFDLTATAKAEIELVIARDIGKQIDNAKKAFDDDNTK